MIKSTIQYSTSRNFSLITTFMFMWVAINFSPQLADVFGYVLILSVGILHGSNDLILIKKALSNKKLKMTLVLMVYLLVILTAAVLFYKWPLMALTSFVLFSAYHFGEQHWANRVKGNAWAVRFFFFCYGMAILLLLFFCNFEDTSAVIFDITQYSLPENTFLNGLVFFGIISIALGSYLVHPDYVKKKSLEELFYFLLFFLLFKAASLIWGFAVYFVLWHAIPSLNDQIKYLHGELNIKTVLSYVRESLLNWLVALLGLTLMYFVFKDDDSVFITIFFSFLAAITFPHVLVISKIYKQ